MCATLSIVKRHGGDKARKPGYTCYALAMRRPSAMGVHSVYSYLCTRPEALGIQPRAANRAPLSVARRTASTFDLVTARPYDFSSQHHHT